MYRIQDIFIRPYTGNELLTHMYYRGNNFIYQDDEKTNILKNEGRWDFFTYFNSLSYEKWKKYTYAKKFFLVIEAKGKFELNIFGHYFNKEHIEKEGIGHFYLEYNERTKIVVAIPKTFKSQVIAFELAHKETIYIYDAYYAVEVDDDHISEPYIALTTTTFKKESYIEQNIEILNEELFHDEEYGNHFCWNIVDNGCTLPEQTDENERIRIFHNKNVGGAGGFARGMIEGLIQKKTPTHILLMDDDVNFSAESFKRLYKLLSIIRPEYKEYFVSGAMLKMNAPNIQHEDIGKLNSQGFHEATKPNLDLNLWDSVLKNEQIDNKSEHQYAAWWFCCIPVGVARLDNLPLPLFVRGDDVEYSLRNNAHFISMNGICIWHDGFEGKFSAALEYYQVERNELILTAMHSELEDVDVFGHIEEIFWQEIYKFNYKGASLLLDAVEDYLKGPDYFSSIDLFEKLQEKRALDNQLQPITDEVRCLINYEQLFSFVNIPTGKKLIYDYSYNGQARIPEFLIKKKIGVIPYGWGYFPGKQYLTIQNYAIEPLSDRYAVFTKNRTTFKEIEQRFEKLRAIYRKNNDSVSKAYREACKQLTSIDFWTEYLK